MKIQRVKVCEGFTWTVLAEDFLPIEPIEQFLAYLRSTEISPNTVRSYAYHLKLYWQFLQNFELEVINVAGQVVESNVAGIETPDLEWFKRNIQAQALPNGSCALPTISQGCPHVNACLTCIHFRTTVEFLGKHKKQLEQTEQIIEKAKVNGWTRKIEMNLRVKSNLEILLPL